MHFWITRRSYKGTSYSYYDCLGRLWRPTRRFNRPDASTGVSPVASLPVVACPRTSYWPVGTRRIRAGVGEIDAITAVLHFQTARQYEKEMLIVAVLTSQEANPFSALSEADTSNYASDLAKLLPSSTDDNKRQSSKSFSSQQYVRYYVLHQCKLINIFQPGLSYVKLAAVRRRSGAMRPSTRKNLDSCQTLFLQFCINYGVKVENPTVDDVGAFTELLTSAGLSFATIKNYCIAVKTLYAQWGLIQVLKNFDTPAWRFMLKGLAYSATT